MGVAAVVREFLAGEGLAPELVCESPAAPNVVATVAGARPGPHLIFNAHMDTMQPGDESRWSVPVYEVTRRFLLSGEGPGFMDAAPAEKGLLWLDLEASGDGGHSSRALRGRTAAAKLSALLMSLDAINDERATVPKELGGISGGPDEAGLRVSLNAGTLAAGGVRSLIASKARAEIDVRLPPGVSAAYIEKRVRAAVSADGVAVLRVKAWDANWTALDNPLVAGVASAALAVRGEGPRFVVRLPGSDARRWRELGVPAVCYGPQPTLSAGIDDYAEEKDVLDCAKVYARTALALLAA